MWLNLEKCVFGVGGGKFLEFMLSHRGIWVNIDKFQAFIEMRSLDSQGNPKAHFPNSLVNKVPALDSREGQTNHEFVEEDQKVQMGPRMCKSFPKLKTDTSHATFVSQARHIKEVSHISVNL